MGFKALEALEYMKQFNKENILISGSGITFDLTILDQQIPHLLGLQYINKDLSIYKGFRLYKEIYNNKLSDQEILKRVFNNHGEKTKNNVEKRINTFIDFMKTLDKGYITEKTLATKMDVNYLIVHEKENNNKIEYYHLGIMKTNNGSFITGFDEIPKDILKTYFIEENKDYFEESTIKENIEKIERYDEKTASYVPFSFDVEVKKTIQREKPSIIEKLNRPLKMEEKTHKNTKTKNKEMEL